MSKSIHAEEMALYAQDAMETDEPWLLWEMQLRNCDGEWIQRGGHPEWTAGCNYRRITPEIPTVEVVYYTTLRGDFIGAVKGSERNLDLESNSDCTRANEAVSEE